MNEQDHDLLIQVSTKITTLCDYIAELKTDVKELKSREMPCAGQLDKCNNVFQKFDERVKSLDKRIDKRSKWGQLAFVLVIVSGIVGSLITMNYTQDWVRDDKINIITERVIKNEEAVEHFHKIPK